MIYLFGGLLASLAMLLYRRPPGRTSPLWNLTLESSALAARLRGDGGRIAGAFGLTLSFTILFLIAAVRYGIGTDYWPRYAPLFERLQYNDVPGQEPGFVLLNRAVGALTDDYQGIFVATSFLTIALIYRFFVRMSVNPALSVFIYSFGGFYLEAFNLMKQGLAIALLVNTIEFALRKQHVAFVLITLLAASMHGSALVWFAVWPLMWFRLGRAARISLAAAMIGVVLAAPVVLSSLIARLAPEYAWYFDSNYGVTRSIHPAVVVAAVAAFAFALVKVGRADKGDRYGDAIVNLLSVNAAVLVATLTVAYLFSRLGYYFAPSQLVGVPLALSLVRRHEARHLLTTAFMLLYLTSFVFQFLVWNAHGVLPYETVFSR